MSVGGTPFEMGVQYGEKAKEIIWHSAKYWHSQLSGATERSTSEMIEIVRRNSDISAKSFPELYKEIQGVGKGSGVSLDDVLLATFNNAVTSSRMAGCSNFAARGAATTDGRAIMGRNLDYDYAVRNHMVIVRAKPKNGNSWIGSRCGAIIGVHDGINSQGIAGGWASVLQRPGERVDGMAFFQALQAAFLRASTVAEAAEIVAKMPKCVGGNYTFCSDESSAVLEAGSRASALRNEEDDVILGTNHWRTPEMIERQGPNKMEIIGSTFCPRYVCGERYLYHRRGELGTAEFEEMLSTHETPPSGQTGICAHKDLFSGTISSFIGVPSKGLAYYASGHPCSNTFEPFRLSPST